MDRNLPRQLPLVHCALGSGSRPIPSIQTLLDAAEAGSAFRQPAIFRRPIAPPAYHGSEQSQIYFNGRLLRTYMIADMPYTMQVPDNEEINWSTRKTIDGRTLTYKLHVMQQPERARACGAGARSAADRRPVDPPPVIELRVFEGEDRENLVDITMKHNATFILCASLEIARPIAHGRIHAPQTIASLQGVNFAGVNYLDRPLPAGYFLFPDLSVRNEGWYRLNFSLLEGTKEAQDSDPNRPFPPSYDASHEPQPTQPLQHESMATRLEVRSKPFQVFSAKKFPGLKESTDLSRLVADQGCRVRIRRDVRMRKHTDRRKEEMDASDDGRRSEGRIATPDTTFQPGTPIHRTRSASRASMDGSQYSVDHYRRISADVGYPTRTYHSGPPSLPSALPSPSMAFPTQALPMAAPHPPMSYISCPPPMSPLHPTPMPNSFVIPHPRLSHDSGAYQPPPEPKPAYQLLPDPASLPRAMTPDNSRPMAEPAVSTTSSTYALTDNTPQACTTFDANRNRWNVPETQGASKRSYSPTSSYVQSQPLKGGQRPDALKGIKSIEADSMDPDPRAYESDSDNYDEASNMMMMKYRRANGDVVKKPLPTDGISGH